MKFSLRHSAFRKDRWDRSGRGTYTLLRDIMGVQQTALESDFERELAWTKIWYSWIQVCLCNLAACYRNQMRNKISIDELEASLAKICTKTNSHVWIGGDFNFPGYDWTNNLVKAKCNHSKVTGRFANIMEDNNLTQVAEEPTFEQNTLDPLCQQPYMCIRHQRNPWHIQGCPPCSVCRMWHYTNQEKTEIKRTKALQQSRLERHQRSQLQMKHSCYTWCHHPCRYHVEWLHKDGWRRTWQVCSNKAS